MDVKKKQPRSAWTTGLIAIGLVIVAGIGSITTLGKNANMTFTSAGTAIGGSVVAQRSTQAKDAFKDDGPAWAWRDRRVEETLQPTSMLADGARTATLKISKSMRDNAETVTAGAKFTNANQDNKNKQDAPPEPITTRKIVRSGEMEFEVPSFDAAVMTITGLVNEIKGAFVATMNSEKVANGKVRGTVSVRVPPEQLDSLVLGLRRELGKGLKGQRLGCQDISKQYADLESRLRAARTMEERLLQIIKTGKGEIQDLVQAEKEVGVWRTKIEEIEGEIRYFANLVALSTLTITLHEREVSPRKTTVLRLAMRDVPAGYRKLQEAVSKANGHIMNAQLNGDATQYVVGQLDFDVRHEDQATIDAVLSEIGEVYSRNVVFAPADENVMDDKVRMRISLNSAVDLKPRKNATLAVEVTDVEKTTATLSTAVADSGGSIFLSGVTHKRDGSDVAKLVFDVPLGSAAELVEKLKGAGRIRLQESVQNGQGAEVALEVARFDVSLSTEPITLADGGLWPQITKGFSASIMAILWSFSWLGFVLVVGLPWAALSFCGYRVFVRFGRKPVLPQNANTTPVA
jgi:hypothetical protein